MILSLKFPNNYLRKPDNSNNTHEILRRHILYYGLIDKKQLNLKPLKTELKKINSKTLKKEIL